MSFSSLLAVAFGGALGAVARYLAGIFTVMLLGNSFPYGTLLVNVLGSFGIGVAYVYLVAGGNFSDHYRAFVMVGFLGAFTTFSTFSLETLHLYESGDTIKATLNILSSLFCCFLACWLGVLIAR